MKKNINGFLYPVINKRKCIKCGACSNVCHILNPPEKSFPLSFYTYRGDDRERLLSSSGAFFPFVAKKMLEKGYYVVGVVFSDDYISAKYVITKSYKTINTMRKSKYIEADITGIYEELKKLLRAGEKVFFVGLPCHVAGLLNYVKEHKNLVTMDLICFGAGSPSIYKNCLHYFLKEKSIDENKISLVDFRHKPFLDGTHTVIDIKAKDKNYTIKAKDFPYYYGFVNRLLLRESCYQCQYNSIERCSDITIGDVLGNGDALGANVVFCNTCFGEKALEILNKQASLHAMNKAQIEENVNRFYKRKKPENYKRIMTSKNYTHLRNKYLRPNAKNESHALALMRNIVKKIVKCVKKL